jgi:hypothetical protein
MADYDTVIAQAVEGLDQNTSKTRRALYERARAAQVKHLRAIHPPLSESAITKERLSLERAIRKVEADTAGKSETGPRESKPDLAQPHTAGVRELRTFRGVKAKKWSFSIRRIRNTATNAPAGRAIAQVVNQQRLPSL